MEKAADEILATLEPQVEHPEDVRDVLQKHRQQQMQAAAQAAEDYDDGGDAEAEARGALLKSLPPALTRRYQVRLEPLHGGGSKPMPLREVHAEHIGQLVKVSGIVTRVSDVKPLVEVATHICYQCGFEIYQEVGLKENFTPISCCPSEHCQRNNLTGKLFMQTRGSKFVSYQEVKLQEKPDEVRGQHSAQPDGHMPRRQHAVLFPRGDGHGERRLPAEALHGLPHAGRPHFRHVPRGGGHREAQGVLRRGAHERRDGRAHRGGERGPGTASSAAPSPRRSSATRT